MEQIAIIGPQTLLGSHLVKAFKDTLPSVRMNLWDYATDGLDTLTSVLQNCDVVFNLHEVQDLRITPDVVKLDQHNAQFVQHLLRCCCTAGCRHVVHLSSVYLQASVKWPNVHGREAEQFDSFRNECPFPEYCESKFTAEQHIRAAATTENAIHSVIARVGPLYGEGDRHSVVCDCILVTKLIGAVPLIGDQDGTLQFTYAGNAAHALLHCAKKFFDCDTIFGTETVLISDGTPLKDIYRVLLEPIMDTEEGEQEQQQQQLEEKEGEEQQHVTTDSPNAANVPRHCPIRIGRVRFPFLPFYAFYWLLAVFIRLFGVGQRDKMPCPNFFYMLFRNWTFFSDFKLCTFFHYSPPVDWPNSLRRSRHYYRQLKADQIDRFSWMPSH